MSVRTPTNLAPGQSGELLLWVVNVGGGATDGSAITVTDTPGAGLVVTNASGVDMYKEGPHNQLYGCGTLPDGGGSCGYSGIPVDPGDVLLITLGVSVGAGVPEGSSLANQVSVSGGGAPSAFVSAPVMASSNTRN